MAGLPGSDALFEGRHFDREIHCPVRAVVLALRAGLPTPGGDDGRARATAAAWNAVMAA